VGSYKHGKDVGKNVTTSLKAVPKIGGHHRWAKCIAISEQYQ